MYHLFSKMVRLTLFSLAASTLTACSWFGEPDTSGGGGVLKIVHCEVEFDQVAGQSGAAEKEYNTEISVDENCTVTINADVDVKTENPNEE